MNMIERNFDLPESNLNVLGFKIKYIVDGIEEEQLIYPFKYFSGIVSFKEEVYVRSDN